MTDIVGRLMVLPGGCVLIDGEDPVTSLAELVRQWEGEEVRVFTLPGSVRSWLVIEIPPDPMREGK